MTELYEKPIRIEFNNEKINVNGQSFPYTARKLSEMKTVMRGDVDIDLAGNQEVYHMYREITKNNNIRYDITVIPAKIIEKEYNKTYGHYHPIAEENLTYPEIYQVLLGKAVFILQKPNRNGSVDVKIINAKTGEVVLIPPGYGHVTINPENKETLVLANLVSSLFESEYTEYKKNRGAAYYYMNGGEIVQNPQYIIQKTERLNASEMNEKIGLPYKDLLKEFTENPDAFRFLNKPAIVFSKSVQ